MRRHYIRVARDSPKIRIDRDWRCELEEIYEARASNCGYPDIGFISSGVEVAFVGGGHCETRTHAASRSGTFGRLLSLADLSAVHRSMAFQVAFGNEKRNRADVSELVYRARPLPAAGCQKTVVAPLPDYLCRVPVFGPCCGDDYPNCGSVEARRPSRFYGRSSFRRHRCDRAGTLTTKTSAARRRSNCRSIVVPR